MALKQQQIAAAVNAALKQKIDPVYRDGVNRFFKEEINAYGVRVPEARKIAKSFWTEVKQGEVKEILSLCEHLLQTGEVATQLIALDWAKRVSKKLPSTSLPLLKRWIEKYITNWATCDDLCCGVLGRFLFEHQELASHIHSWTTSKNRWLRRASAVALIYGVRRQAFYTGITQTAETLLHDDDDLVQKGYGWSLKEMSKSAPNQVHAFVQKHKKTMPRTALRYAIEHYPKEIRADLMK